MKANLKRQPRVIPPLAALRPANERLVTLSQRTALFAGLAALVGLNQLGLRWLPAIAVYFNALLLVVVAICCLKLLRSRGSLAGLLIIITVNCLAMAGRWQKISGQLLYSLALLGLSGLYIMLCQTGRNWQRQAFTAKRLGLVGSLGLVTSLTGFELLHKHVREVTVWWLASALVAAVACELLLRGLVQAQAHTYSHRLVNLGVTVWLGVTLAAGGQPWSRQLSQALIYQAAATGLFYYWRDLRLNLVYSLSSQIVLVLLLITAKT